MHCYELINALLRTHKHKKHPNRSYDERETTTERFVLNEKKKTISFICFNNYIKHG
jgi:hypothetical protein